MTKLSPGTKASYSQGKVRPMGLLHAAWRVGQTAGQTTRTRPQPCEFLLTAARVRRQITNMMSQDADRVRMCVVYFLSNYLCKNTGGA